MTRFAMVIVAISASPGDADEENAFFERRVRPVLANHCFSCHGPQRQESGLRLDSRQAVLRGGDRGPIVEPGHPEQSLLIRAIRRQDDLQMPPEQALTASQVEAVSEWVKQRLPWPQTVQIGSAPHDSRTEHWAFQPIRKPPLPAIEDNRWAQTPIDHFILARLAEHDLLPSQPADRVAFIRRATFDLTGLPPTPEAVSDFVQDDRLDATAGLIDRLLASPRYGERWGRHWLDIARYADNKGYVFFEDKKYPWAYTYRNYVIRAFNQDRPFNRFVVEQLAADQLDLADDQRPLTALGFLTVGGHFMNNTHDIIDDRIDVVTRGLLGLTVTCARCHDHKYDPLPQADYYSLYGVFRSCYEPIVPPLFEPPPETEEYRQFAAEMEKRQQALVDFVTHKHATLVEDARTRIADYLLAAHARRGQPRADDFMLLVEQGDLNPSMILRWQVYLDDPLLDHEVWAPWRKLAGLAHADFSERASLVLAELFAARSGDSVNALVQHALSERPLGTMEEVAGCYHRLLQRVDQQWRQSLALAKKSGRAPPERLADAGGERLRQVLYGASSPAQAPLTMDWGFLSLFPDRPTQSEYKKLLKDVEQWSTTGPAAPARAMVLLDSPTPHTPRVFRRGNPNRLGDEVPRRFLTAIAPYGRPFTHGSGRLELAKAIVDPANPLTARVLVNRVWMHHFGQGLVRTPSDFGLRSEPPSHSDLLDYLAAKLIDSGWSIKQLHRLIMSSAVYRQTSAESSETRTRQANPLSVDPENRLLWKMNRRRLEFEALRDSLLAVSGRLESSMFGPPLELFGSDAGGSRRSVYGFVDRMDVSSLLTTFDFPNPAASSPQRTATTVPPQSLYLMNNAFAKTVARQLVQRPDILHLPDIVSRENRIYLWVFGREPTPDERSWADDFLGPNPSPDDWAVFGQALLMTNEFVFVD